MPATVNAIGRRGGKPLIAVLLLIGLMVGLAACRGFFGQAPIALLVVTAPTDDQEVPVTVTFDISGSTDPDGTIATYDLDYGDGSTHATGTVVPTAEFTHEYTEGGTYTVTLTVTDNDGRIGKVTKIVVLGPAMLTFASKRTGNYGIYRMQVDNIGSETEVRNTLDEELFPDLVRGTRDKIAYAAEDGTRWNIFTMGVDGGALAQLTQQTPSNQIQPSWSYDGTYIVYASNGMAAQTPSASTWQIWRMTAAGGSQAALIIQTNSWAPAYSPKNNNIVFVSEKNNTGTGSALWFRNGTTATQLWPASSTIHTYRYGDASTAGFLTTGLALALNLPTKAGISKPAWSPDGTKIAFSSDKAGAGVSDIYVIDISTTGTASNERTLEAYVNSLITGTVTSGQITDTAKDEFCPYWLEDKSGLAFVRKGTTYYDIYKVSFSDGTVTKLTSAGDNVTPAARR